MQPFVLLTDGAFEENGGSPLATLGAVLFDPTDHTVHFFAAQLAGEALAALLETSSNPIITVELLAVFLGIAVWMSRVRGRSLLGFIDNDGAKHVLAKGGTTSLEASAVCDGVSACEIAGAVLRFRPAGNFQCTECDPCGTGASALLGPK